MIAIACGVTIGAGRIWGGEKIAKVMAIAGGSVRYLGYVAPEDKPALYKNASLFVYPSLYEGFGFPVVEAFVAGTPVITSNRSSLPEVAGDAAYLVNPLNVSDIALAIQRLLSDQTLRLHYIAKGKARAAQFSWGRAAEELLSMWL